MTSTNRELADAAYAAINARDLDAFLAIVHPDVEFGSLVAEAEDRTFRGHDGVREWWESVSEALGGLRFEVFESHEAGDWIVVGLHVTAHVGGVDVPQTMWQASRAQDDRPIWWHTFRTRDEALEAAGLEV